MVAYGSLLQVSESIDYVDYRPAFNEKQFIASVYSWVVKNSE